MLIGQQQNRLQKWIQKNIISEEDDAKNLIATYKYQSAKIIEGVVDLILILSKENRTKIYMVSR